MRRAEKLCTTMLVICFSLPTFPYPMLPKPVMTIETRIERLVDAWNTVPCYSSWIDDVDVGLADRMCSKWVVGGSHAAIRYY